MKMIFLIILFCSALFGGERYEEHDIHISICELDLRKSTPRLTIKTFLDDLQVAVGLEPGQDLPAGYTSSDELIADYVHRSIKLFEGKDSLVYDIVSIDASTDAVWINCELSEDTALSHIQITNTFLTEIYDDQANLIKLITTSGRKTKSMDGASTELLLELD